MLRSTISVITSHNISPAGFYRAMTEEGSSSGQEKSEKNSNKMKRLVLLVNFRVSSLIIIK